MSQDKGENQAKDKDKVAVVTGANKGLGLSLVRILCRSGYPGTVYLTSRDEGRGRAALELLQGEGLNPRYHQLDLASSDSIRRLAEHVKTEHGGLDVLIANGSIPFSPGMDYQQVEEAIRTNNKGNAELCTTFLPLFRPDGRLLIVSSGFGQVVHLGPELRHKFLATDSMGVEDLHNLLDDYLRAFKAGDAEQKGWPDWGNKVNKIGLVALARILDQQVQRNPSLHPGLLVNAVCPGWTVTDASRPWLDQDNKFGDVQAKLPDEAAVDVVWLATLPPAPPSLPDSSCSTARSSPLKGDLSVLGVLEFLYRELYCPAGSSPLKNDLSVWQVQSFVQNIVLPSRVISFEG